ncbi:MAG: DEAD/DEAH box helicase [Candidatus Nanohalobium sp.]
MKVENLEIPERIRQEYIKEGITELNPPQEMAVSQGLMDGEDMIVASPTASGKTFIAELAMVNQVVENGKTAVYIVPLKALASEKYEDFSERYEGLDVRISVGDLDDEGKGLETADIVVVTSEKLDSILRHNPSWIHEIGLVVVDEIHLLTSENRGPTLEVTLTRLRELLDFQLLGLSATISNSDQLADWLDAELVESDYRPVDLSHGVYWGSEIEFYPDGYEKPDSGPNEDGSSLETPEGWSTGTEVKERNEEVEEESEIVELEDEHGRGTLNIIEDTLKKDKQTITFCSSRKGAEKASDRATKAVEPRLSRDEKKELEEYSEKILNVLGNPTSQCERLAENVSQGTAFHHAGLCVSGDSVIMHSDGVFSKMDDLMENSKETALGLSDYSITDNEIQEKYEMDEKPLLKIKTGRGREIKVSRNHQLPVLAEGGLEWRKSKNLSEEDRIAVPRKIDLDVEPPRLRNLLRDEVRAYRKYDEVDELVEEVEIEGLEQDFRKRYREDRNISVGGLREICEELGENPEEYLDVVMSKAGQKPVRIPEKLDKDLAWLIGAVAGDGYIGSSAVNLSGSETRLLERFEDIVDQKLDRNVSVNKRKKDDVKTYSFNAKAVSDILHDYFGIPREKKAQNLKMPEIGLPDELLASYIRGLFDTDGSVNRRENSEGASCIEFYTASDRLATELHTSLLRFGINAHRDRRKTEGRETEIRGEKIHTNGDIHRLKIYGSDQLRKYRDEIGFTHPEKKSRLDEAIEINPEGGRKQNDVIPETLGTKARKMRNEKNLSLSELEPEVSKSTVSRFENHKTPIKRETFQKLAEKLEDTELQKIANSDIYWSKIKQIEEKEPEKLYDISTSTENFIANGIIAHNTTEQRQLVEEAFRKGLIKSVSATPTLAAGVNLPAYRVIIRDLKRYTGNGMDFIPVLEYEQQTGRAGRPKYDDRGEAISIAKQPGMKEEILDRYILGEPERIQSKLAVEPVLRMHTLSLVASNFCTTMEQLISFYKKTFYAYQFAEPKASDRPSGQEDSRESSGMYEVEQTIKEVVETLRDYEFLKEHELEATKVGHRVSELYIDPDSAHHMLEALKTAEERKLDGRENKPVSYLFMLSRTTEMNPLLRVNDDEWTDIEKALLDAEKYILESVPEEWDVEYERFMRVMKTSMMMQAWISELDEEKIMNEYGTAPGGIRAKMRNADWLVYGAQELARMKELDVGKDLEKIRLRLKHGIKEELLGLVKYDQIGRVRARKLHDHGVRDREDIREVSFEKLKKLIGKRTAKKLKKQVGEENIFDRENILDYYD